MREINYCSLEYECPYLKNELCRLEYKYIYDCTIDMNNELTKRGWRRFGRYFSRPICKSCNECISIRILANEYKFSKSEKRVFRKNVNTKVVLRRPLMDDEHLLLYDKYHKLMKSKKDWKIHQMDFKKYYNLYVVGFLDFGYELSFYVDKKLVCVDLIDFLKDGISSIYCYYDPDYAHLSLGKFSLLKEIEFAKNFRLKYIYLGYFVKKCQSLTYKADYTPNEILKGTYSLFEDEILWER